MSNICKIMKAEETDWFILSLIQEVSWRKLKNALKGMLSLLQVLISHLCTLSKYFLYTSLSHNWTCNWHISEGQNLQQLILMLRTLIRDSSRTQSVYVFTFTATYAINTDIQVEHMVWSFLNTELSS